MSAATATPAKKEEKTGLLATVANNARQYGIVGALLVIVVAFEVLTGGVLLKPNSFTLATRARLRSWLQAKPTMHRMAGLLGRRHRHPGLHYHSGRHVDLPWSRHRDRRRIRADYLPRIPWHCP